MKKLISALVIAALWQAVCLPLAAQSRSFQAFKSKFSGEENVHCFNVNGFLVRSVLALAGEDEAKEAIRGIHRVRLAVVPRAAFQEKNVTVAGFRRVLKDDLFEEMMDFREDGDHVTVFSNTPADRDDQCYMMLVEDEHEIVLIEVSGIVNEAYFRNLVKLQAQRT